MSKNKVAQESDALGLYLIVTLPSTAYYIPSFLTPTEASYLESSVLHQPKSKWTYLTYRRLQTHPSALTPSGHLMTTTPLPSWLTSPAVERMQELGIWKDSPHAGPNHVLVNEYEPGQGISRHEDGAAYWPLVATVSLGGTVVLEVIEKAKVGSDEGDGSARVYRILQEPGSLLITTNELYTQHLHGIQEIGVDEDLNSTTVANWNLLGDPEAFEDGKNIRETRISLTYRDVLKVSKVGGLLLGKLKS